VSASFFKRIPDTIVEFKKNCSIGWVDTKTLDKMIVDELLAKCDRRGGISPSSDALHYLIPDSTNGGDSCNNGPEG